MPTPESDAKAVEPHTDAIAAAEAMFRRFKRSTPTSYMTGDGEMTPDGFVPLAPVPRENADTALLVAAFREFAKRDLAAAREIVQNLKSDTDKKEN